MLKREKNIDSKALLQLYKIYLMQANQEIDDKNAYCCKHDDSGGHPDYHCDTHDNTPSKRLRLINNVTN